MATVYLALDVGHDRKVALKVLKPELMAVLGAERFVHEIGSGSGGGLCSTASHWQRWSGGHEAMGSRGRSGRRWCGLARCRSWPLVPTGGW